MEVDKNLDDNTNKICRLVLNFAYDDMLNQFINDNGNCKESTYQLLNSVLSNELLESGKVTRDHHYKLLFTYLIYLFSKYLKTNQIDVLVNIRGKLFDENSTRLLPYVIINQFKTICLKTMAFLIKKNPLEGYCVEFENFINDHELIGDIDSYDDYNNEALYKDICEIIKNDSQKHNKSLLSLIIEYFDKKCDNEHYIDCPEPYMKFLETPKSPPLKVTPAKSIAPPVNKTPEKMISEMILADVYDDELVNCNGNNNNDVDLSEKENNVVNKSSSKITIEKLANTKSPTNHDANNFFINLKTPFIDKAKADKNNSDEQILKEQSANEKNIRNSLFDDDDDDEICKTPRNLRNRLNKITDEELCASPKILANKITTDRAMSEDSSIGSDSGLCYRLRRPRSNKNKPKKSQKNDKNKELEENDKGKDNAAQETEDFKFNMEIESSVAKRTRRQTRPFNEEEIVLVDDDDSVDMNSNTNNCDASNKKDNNSTTQKTEAKEAETEKAPKSTNAEKLKNQAVGSDDDGNISSVSISGSNFKRSEIKATCSPQKTESKKHETEKATKSTNKSAGTRKSLQMASNILNSDDDDDDDDFNISSVSLSGSKVKKTEPKPSSSPKKSKPLIKTKTKTVVKSSSESEESNKETVQLKSKKRRTKTTWDANEVIYLVYGVQKYGIGNWADILSLFKSKFKEGRTNIDLKDKYRNLKRNNDDLEFYSNQAKLLGNRIKAKLEKKEVDERSSKRDRRSSSSSSSENETKEHKSKVVDKEKFKKF